MFPGEIGWCSKVVDRGDRFRTASGVKGELDNYILPVGWVVRLRATDVGDDRG